MSHGCRMYESGTELEWVLSQNLSLLNIDQNMADLNHHPERSLSQQLQLCKLVVVARELLQHIRTGGAEDVTDRGCEINAWYWRANSSLWRHVVCNEIIVCLCACFTVFTVLLICSDTLGRRRMQEWMIQQLISVPTIHFIKTHTSAQTHSEYIHLSVNCTKPLYHKNTELIWGLSLAAGNLSS